jgi:hypothetical protein
LVTSTGRVIHPTNPMQIKSSPMICGLRFIEIYQISL